MISLVFITAILLNFYGNLSSKLQEIVNYLFFGVCTTLVSIVSYFVLRLVIDNYMICTVLSWILAVLFAYVTNRIYVFKSKEDNKLKEFVSFISSRILTLLLELDLMFVLVDIMSLSDRISKIGVQVIVIVANYVLSKLIVFKRKD